MSLASALGSGDWRRHLPWGERRIVADTPSAHAEDESASLLDRQSLNVEVAAGKAISFLWKIDALGFLSIERSSVYGAAVAIPQIARSTGWPATFLALAIRCYMFLLLNVLLQGFLLAVMNEEAHIMSPFAGKMHLCDFGAFISRCPDGPNCRGPGGTTYDFQRLRSWDVWSTRVFFRDALKALFPEKMHDITEAADPGEYGLEDYYCRLMCCLLFIMAVVDDLNSTLQLGAMLYNLPTRAEPWIKYEVPDWMNKDEAKRVHNWCELDLVKFQIAGMPLGWKLLNTAVVLLPKSYIWWTLVSTGFHYLMETAGIMDLVINCMALKFVLSMDEIVFARLATEATKYILENIEEVALFDTSQEERETHMESAERFKREEFEEKWWSKILRMIIPRRLFYIFALMTVFIFRYYHNYCDCLEDGSCISKPIYLPENVTYNPISFIHGVFLQVSQTPLWSMPPG